MLIPLKNGFLEKISTCLGKRSPTPETSHNTLSQLILGYFFSIILWIKLEAFMKTELPSQATDRDQYYYWKEQ